MLSDKSLVFVLKVYVQKDPFFCVGIRTRTMESLAAKAKISAQETVCGQVVSNAALISSMTSNPRTELLLGMDPFSLITLRLPPLSSNTDASHP